MRKNNFHFEFDPYDWLIQIENRQIDLENKHNLSIRNQKELAIALIIREKREYENLSYHKIAKFLNSQRLRAKRGGRWYAETVKVICENTLYERDSKAAKDRLSR